MVFSKKSSITVDTLTPKTKQPSTNGAVPQIDPLEYFPEKVLLQIFSEVDDMGLLHLSDCSYRFEVIAKIAFKKRYATQYFVFDSDTKTERKMYCDLFERFGRYANMKAVEVKSIQNFDENHWITKFLIQYTIY